MAHRFTLYGMWRSGPTYKVALMLSFCGEPFDYVHVDLLAGEHKKPEFLAKNRFGQVPCLVDGDNHLCQSASILEYLAETLGKFGGHSPVERQRLREWMFWDFDRLTPAIYRSRAVRLGVRQADPAVLSMYDGEGKLALGVLDHELSRSEWLVGYTPSIADIDVYGVVHYAGEAGFDLEAFPHLRAWKARFEALPGFKQPEELMTKPA